MFYYYQNLAKRRGQEKDFNLHYNFYILAGYDDYQSLRMTIDALQLYGKTRQDKI